MGSPVNQIIKDKIRGKPNTVSTTIGNVYSKSNGIWKNTGNLTNIEDITAIVNVEGAATASDFNDVSDINDTVVIVTVDIATGITKSTRIPRGTVYRRGNVAWTRSGILTELNTINAIYAINIVDSESSFDAQTDTSERVVVVSDDIPSGIDKLSKANVDAGSVYANDSGNWSPIQALTGLSTISTISAIIGSSSSAHFNLVSDSNDSVIIAATDIAGITKRYTRDINRNAVYVRGANDWSRAQDITEISGISSISGVTIVYGSSIFNDLDDTNNHIAVAGIDIANGITKQFVESASLGDVYARGSTSWSRITGNLGNLGISTITNFRTPSTASAFNAIVGTNFLITVVTADIGSGITERSGADVAIGAVYTRGASDWTAIQHLTGLSGISTVASVIRANNASEFNGASDTTNAVVIASVDIADGITKAFTATTPIGTVYRRGSANWNNVGDLTGISGITTVESVDVVANGTEFNAVGNSENAVIIPSVDIASGITKEDSIAILRGSVYARGASDWSKIEGLTDLSGISAVSSIDVVADATEFNAVADSENAVIVPTAGIASGITKESDSSTTIGDVYYKAVDPAVWVRQDNLATIMDGLNIGDIVSVDVVTTAAQFNGITDGSNKVIVTGVGISGITKERGAGDPILASSGGNIWRYDGSYWIHEGRIFDVLDFNTYANIAAIATIPSSGGTDSDVRILTAANSVPVPSASKSDVFHFFRGYWVDRGSLSDLTDIPATIGTISEAASPPTTGGTQNDVILLDAEIRSTIDSATQGEVYQYDGTYWVDRGNLSDIQANLATTSGITSVSVVPTGGSQSDIAILDTTIGAINSATKGELYQYDGSYWIDRGDLSDLTGIPATIGAIRISTSIPTGGGQNDVTIVNAAISGQIGSADKGDVFQHDGTYWVDRGSLEDLTGIPSTIGSISTSDPVPLSGGSENDVIIISDNSTGQIGSTTEGEIFQYDGTYWKDRGNTHDLTGVPLTIGTISESPTIPLSSIGTETDVMIIDAVISGEIGNATKGDIYQYDGSYWVRRGSLYYLTGHPAIIGRISTATEVPTSGGSSSDVTIINAFISGAIGSADKGDLFQYDGSYWKDRGNLSDMTLIPTALGDISESSSAPTSGGAESDIIVIDSTSTDTIGSATKGDIFHYNGVSWADRGELTDLTGVPATIQDIIVTLSGPSGGVDDDVIVTGTTLTMITRTDGNSGKLVTLTEQGGRIDSLAEYTITSNDDDTIAGVLGDYHDEKNISIFRKGRIFVLSDSNFVPPIGTQRIKPDNTPGNEGRAVATVGSEGIGRVLAAGTHPVLGNYYIVDLNLPQSG